MLTDYLHLVESLQKYLASLPKDKPNSHIAIAIQELAHRMPTTEYLSNVDKPLVQEWFARLNIFLNQSGPSQEELNICLTEGADIIRKYLSNRL